jgi:uncharacterized protein (UPF0216 family)
MISAAEAKQKTLERINQLAKEFIINNTGIPIQTAINNGKFFTNVSLEGKDLAKVDTEVLGAEIVKLLEEKGYKAEHMYYDGPQGYDNYVIIKWGEA